MDKQAVKAWKAAWDRYHDFQTQEMQQRTMEENLTAAFRMMAWAREMGWYQPEDSPTEGDLRWLELKRRAGRV